MAGGIRAVVASTPEQALQYFGFSPLELDRVRELNQTTRGMLYEVDCSKNKSNSTNERSESCLPF